MSDIEAEVRHNAGFLIWRVSMGWRAAMDRVLEPLGLTQAQYAVLAPLYGMSRSGARPSQRELADLTGLDAVYISGQLAHLPRVTRPPTRRHALANAFRSSSSPPQPMMMAFMTLNFGRASLFIALYMVECATS